MTPEEQLKLAKRIARHKPPIHINLSPMHRHEPKTCANCGWPGSELSLCAVCSAIVASLCRNSTAHLYWRQISDAFKKESTALRNRCELASGKDEDENP
jgi:hypothetical protein